MSSAEPVGLKEVRLPIPAAFADPSPSARRTIQRTHPAWSSSIAVNSVAGVGLEGAPEGWEPPAPEKLVSEAAARPSALLLRAAAAGMAEPDAMVARWAEVLRSSEAEPWAAHSSGAEQSAPSLVEDQEERPAEQPQEVLVADLPASAAKKIVPTTSAAAESSFRAELPAGWEA